MVSVVIVPGNADLLDYFKLVVVVPAVVFMIALTSSKIGSVKLRRIIITVD